MLHSSGNAIEEASIPSVEEELLELVPKSESLEFSVASLPHISAAVDHTLSSDDANIIASDTSPKQVYSGKSEGKFSVFEEAPDTLPPTGMCGYVV
jgi:hypothetical protein